MTEQAHAEQQQMVEIIINTIFCFYMLLTREYLHVDTSCQGSMG